MLSCFFLCMTKNLNTYLGAGVVFMTNNVLKQNEKKQGSRMNLTVLSIFLIVEKN